MPVGVADVDLRVPGGGAGLQDHAVWIVGIGILPIAFRAEELDRGVITRYANREMDVARVERLLTESGTVVNDQVNLLGIAELKPGARKIERRSRDLFDRQDLAVELSRPLDVGYSESNVVKGGDFHTGNRQSITTVPEHEMPLTAASALDTDHSRRDYDETSMTAAVCIDERARIKAIVPNLSRRTFLAAAAGLGRMAIGHDTSAHAAPLPDTVRTDFSALPPYGNGTIPVGIRSRHIANVNGMTVHILEAGYETPGRPAVLLLHGFPELAYSWRKVMPALAAAGYHVIAPDQRGYGRTTGWDDSYDADPDPFRILNMTRDAIGLVYALGHRSVAMIVGHDAGAPVASWSALIRPDIFRSITIMSSPFEGTPALPFDTANSQATGAANGATQPRPAVNPAVNDDELDRELAKLNPPRKYYQNYQRTRGANDDMLHAPQGLHAFFRAYYFYKSADYKGNNPHPLKARTATEMAQIPTYYVMEKDKAWRRPLHRSCRRRTTSRTANG